MNDEQKDRVLELRRRGHTLRYIARETGFTPEWVRQTLYKVDPFWSGADQDTLIEHYHAGHDKDAGQTG